MVLFFFFTITKELKLFNFFRFSLSKTLWHRIAGAITAVLILKPWSLNCNGKTLHILGMRMDWLHLLLSPRKKKEQFLPLKITQTSMSQSSLPTPPAEWDTEEMLDHLHWRPVWKCSSMTAGFVWTVSPSQFCSTYVTEIWYTYRPLMAFNLWPLHCLFLQM